MVVSQVAVDRERLEGTRFKPRIPESERRVIARAPTRPANRSRKLHQGTFLVGDGAGGSCKRGSQPGCHDSVPDRSAAGCEVIVRHDLG
jgi:hypothetical protein